VPGLHDFKEKLAWIARLHTFLREKAFENANREKGTWKDKPWSTTKRDAE